MYEKNSPYEIAAKKGEQVFICQCGQTATPPFCDGHHKALGQRPLVYTPQKDETLYVCGCGHSGTKPWCDGTHNTLCKK